MGQAFLYGNGSGSGTGGILTVTAPAGDTVTISKDGKTKTKTADSSGQAVFKGLKAGTWTVTITNGYQTATKTVNVVTDYAVTMTYFSATITATWPEGSSCTCSDGNTTLTAPTTSGSYTFTVPNAGTWTVSCTDGTDSDSETVTITTDGERKSVELSYQTYLYNLGWIGAATSLECLSRGISDQAPQIQVSYSGGYIVMSKQQWDGYAWAVANVDIDLTNVDTIFCKTGDLGSGGTIYYGAGKSGDSSGNEIPVAKTELSASNTMYTVDVSSLTGNYRLGFYGPTTGKPDWTWSSRKIEAFGFM